MKIFNDFDYAHGNAILRRINQLLALVAFVILGVVTRWEFFPYRTLDVTSPIVIVNQPSPGSTIDYKFSYCKYIDLDSATSKTLQPSSGPTILLPDAPGTLPKGCRSTLSRKTVVPDGTPAGTYVLAFEVSYKVNPLRRPIMVRFRSQPFVIGSRTSSVGAAASTPAAVAQSGDVQSSAPAPDNTETAAGTSSAGTPPQPRTPTVTSAGPVQRVVDGLIGLTRSLL